jgi:hypothetical protein
MKNWKQSVFLGMVAIIAIVFGIVACDDGNGNNDDKDLTGIITITPDTDVLVNTELTAHYSGNETVSYQWKKDGTAINAVGTGAKYIPIDNGAYTVTVSATGYKNKTSNTVTITGNGIDWNNHPSGTVTVVNNSDKNMVLFQGQTPSANQILGGIRALSEKTFDISEVVYEFNVGGYMILRGMTLEEYEANKESLSQAKIEYTAMVTYGQEKKFRAEISSQDLGDYMYRVSSQCRIGIELRKDSFYGKKAGYIPSLGSNFRIYANMPDNITLYPVLVYYTRRDKNVTTFVPGNLEPLTVSPKPISGNEFETYTFPISGANWNTFQTTLVSPAAYVAVTNNVANQSAYVNLTGTGRLISQNGYDIISTGETLTYEILGTDNGTTMQNIVITFNNRSIELPVQNASLKNGFDYEIVISGDGGDQSSGYTITLTEKVKRDLSDDIASL